MMTFFSCLVLLFLLLVLAYCKVALQKSTIIWAIAALLALAFSSLTLILSLPVLAVLIFLSIPSLRLPYFSRPAFSALAKAMPSMSSTEKEALETGSNWWETELFQGQPDWQQFQDYQLPSLSEKEQSFLDQEVEQLCSMVNEWDIHQNNDLPEKAWQFLKNNGFFALIIPESYGGRAFSPYAQSRIMSKIASHSGATAVTAMVPNSLGPGELLLKYGCQEQKDYWLPKLAKGQEIPCFGLTSPEAGSDAGSIIDTGVICRGKYKKKDVLGIKLNFSKRWITLAPVATVIGLAFKLYDPDGLVGDIKEYGISCALIPADTKGIDIGRRHNPGLPFMNGPIVGEDVFVPLDALIGGMDNAGKGWRMLMECLAVGRGISLPALSTASGEMSYRLIGAYSSIRRQFKLPVGKFEGVQEASAVIASNAYTLEAFRHLVTCGLGAGGTPSVMTAMAKYYATEMMRESVNHAMDIAGGRAIQLGPRNFLAFTYQAIPVAITVEGANILTRTLMIFGQGAMRCHPYLFQELQCLQREDEAAISDFDSLLMGHLAYSVNNAASLVAQKLSFSLLSKAPEDSDAFCKPYYQKIHQLSTAFALTSDITLGLLAGDLKRKEMLSGRLADVHSQLFIATSILKYYQHRPKTEEETLLAEVAVTVALAKAQQALKDFLKNFPNRIAAMALKLLILPCGDMIKAPSDKAKVAVANNMLKDDSFRKHMAEFVYQNDDSNDAVGRLENCYQSMLQNKALLKRFYAGQYQANTWQERLSLALEEKDFSAEEGVVLQQYFELEYDCLLTDAFEV